MKFALASSSDRTDNRLAFLDQASFLRLRSTGEGNVAQCTWIYDRAIDIDGLRRFNQNLGRGLLGRRIERSPLPFGRHRWVGCEQSPDIDVAASPRTRADLSAWIDERAQVPIDPEYGPSWHLGVLGLDDGGTAVTLVASHSVVDGVGFFIAISEAVKGEVREFGYPPPQSRGRLRALVADGRDSLIGLPQVLGALIASIWILVRRGPGTASPPTSSPFSASRPGRDEIIVLPALTIFFDLASWDARALELGGTSNSLLIAFAARLAELMGRVSATDGAVTITVPVSERSPDDARANALTAFTFRVDPTRAATDLQAIRDNVKQGLAALHQVPNELLKPLPLIPWVPKWLVRKMEGLALNNSDLPVGCSNLRDWDPVLTRIDGADAEYFSARLFSQGVSRRSIERAHGQLYLVSARVNGKIFISVISYQPGAENSKKYLREMIEQTIADYQLTTAINEYLRFPGARLRVREVRG
jgi:diacylglycerol O-acyltransferase / wax synthase